MRRRLAAILVLAAMIWLPAVSTAPVVRAASSCTVWPSTRIPPSTIRVYRTSGAGAGTVQTVDFRTYVGVVLAAEWSSGWPTAALESGAVAVKEYAWYYVMYPRGYSSGGNCYDVVDNTNDQIYYPEGYSPSAGELAAINATWYESITKSGSLILTGYRAGSDGACGADADSYHLFQASSLNCAAYGRTGDQILQIYYGPGLAIWNTPARPVAVFVSPGSGLGTGTASAVGSATVAWTEEPTPGTTITGRQVALQMALAINGSCVVDRWLSAAPAWTSKGSSPQTATGLKSGYCYRFVVGLTDSSARTTYTASTSMVVDTLAPVATFTMPAAGKFFAYPNSTATIKWTESPLPGTTIKSRTLTTEYAAEPQPGSCAGATWIAGSAVSVASGTVITGLKHYYCYRWRLTLVDSAGHTGTWLSGMAMEPAT